MVNGGTSDKNTMSVHRSDKIGALTKCVNEYHFATTEKPKLHHVDHLHGTHFSKDAHTPDLKSTKGPMEIGKKLTAGAEMLTRMEHTMDPEWSRHTRPLRRPVAVDIVRNGRDEKNHCEPCSVVKLHRDVSRKTGALLVLERDRDESL